MLAVTVEDPDGRLWSYMPFDDCCVQAGDTIEEGAMLGGVAAEGDSSSGEPHLHIGLRVDGRYVDPMGILSAPQHGSGPEQPTTLFGEQTLPSTAELQDAPTRPEPRTHAAPLDPPVAECLPQEVVEPGTTEPGSAVQTSRVLLGNAATVASRDGGHHAAPVHDRGPAKQARLTADAVAIGTLVGLALVVGAVTSVVRVIAVRTPVEVGAEPRPTGLQPR
jgi:hypothetical protein